MFAHIEKREWAILRKHAVKCFPYECTGYFIAIKRFNPLHLDILEIHPCKNVSNVKETSSTLSKKDNKKINKLTREFKGSNFIVGHFHSHPVTGNTSMSVLDKRTGRKYKKFRNQVILGIKKLKDKKLRIKKRFWTYYDTKNRWLVGHVIVK